MPYRGSPVGGVGAIGQAMATAASGMSAQAVRMRLAAENLTNAESTAAVPGGDPYSRRVLTFEQQVDRASGARLVVPGRITRDPGEFRLEYDPGHPAADARGYVKLPNVQPLVEQADLRAAQVSYEASVAVVQQARSMYAKTLEILKG
ncbi:flagellar basal body rod protein FlgC [Paracraurococcus ruber]|uniref:Flagellar basal-body rod protein FlgC n=1 Tax=Paracraurococcus ruber TaxID=77675 RepID=A0ABS1D164_9PROT|nr:flagellar basal body rod protein FlgC [Paracraurococcus ruber]MBK1660037.1 flagellar basal body rod protein FlgC [Paracraurococcus ruber]TDG28618.1 flagellar basal body rod protein FlgC [Paracraurococcus ruber]